MKAIRVLVVDNHDLFRRGLIEVLQHEPDLEIIGEAGNRLEAIEQVLQRNPTLRDRVRFVQISVPSRQDIDEYAEFRSQVDQIVGRINGAFGSASSVPIHYLFRSVSTDELVAL